MEGALTETVCESLKPSHRSVRQLRLRLPGAWLGRGREAYPPTQTVRCYCGSLLVTLLFAPQ